MTEIAPGRTGGAITNMEPGKRGTRAYFDVEDINAGAARVRELGGEANEPGPVPRMGWFSTCRDPQGNEFGLWQNDTSAPPRPSRAPVLGTVPRPPLSFLRGSVVERWIPCPFLTQEVRIR